MRRIGGCHARSSLHASRPFRDVARSNIAPHASPSLLARRRASLACRPWKCRLLGASGTPPLARTRAPLSLALWIGEPPSLLRIEEPPRLRVEVMELWPLAWELPPPHCRRSPSGSGAAAVGLGTTATACRGRGAAATAAIDRGSAAARTLGQPSPSHVPGWVSSLMNRDEA